MEWVRVEAKLEFMLKANNKEEAESLVEHWMRDLDDEAEWQITATMRSEEK